MASLLRIFGANPRKEVSPAAAAVARGDAARDEADWAAAIAAYREALELEPDMTAIRIQYAHALKERGQIEDAVEAYHRAAEATPDDAEIFVHLGHALKRLGRNEDAIAALRTAVDLNPADRESADEIFYLSHAEQAPADAVAAPAAVTSLEDLAWSVRPGISIVTCSRNRTENLVRAMPSWLARTEIDEVIVVDWTSDEPVYEALRDADLLDARVKVIRVEGEPRWILSTAFNVGFRAASRDRILKVDADIVLLDGFFARNSLDEGTFLAGNWRDAAPGQEFINGFFLAYRSDLMGVNGFNEQITTYGWDDDDLYDRLQEAGVRRVGVSVDTISHLPHDDEVRLELKATEFPSAHAQFWSRTSTMINANRIMCFLMPRWRKGLQLQPFAIESVRDDQVIARRSAPPPHAVPEQVRRDVEHYATVEYLSSITGRTAYELGRESVGMLMCAASLDAVTPLSISLALTRADRLSLTGNYLIVKIEQDIREDETALIEGLKALDALAESAGFGLVASDSDAEALRARLADKTPVPIVAHTPGAAEIAPSDLAALGETVVGPGECREIRLSRAIATALSPTMSAPAIARGRDTFYIDAQHGLGNRLRAIASGAAIAGKSSRDLVIVWEPDHHCECDFADLFDYSGAVITRSFLRDARDAGLSVFNYMEVEDGSDRGAAVNLTSGVSAYARSAYVLNSPFSDWETENAFLRALTPTRDVKDLVDGVRSPNDIGVHVRMEAHSGADLASYDSPENWPEADHATLLKWRAKSHFSNFMSHLDKLIEEGKAETIFLAADLPETYAAFAEKYGDRVAYLDRTLYDRSREQMFYALADAILLSRSKSMLGSSWSSFSEIALRLSESFDKIQLSGEDF